MRLNNCIRERVRIFLIDKVFPKSKEENLVKNLRLTIESSDMLDSRRQIYSLYPEPEIYKNNKYYYKYQQGRCEHYQRGSKPELAFFLPVSPYIIVASLCRRPLASVHSIFIGGLLFPFCPSALSFLLFFLFPKISCQNNL